MRGAARGHRLAAAEDGTTTAKEGIAGGALRVSGGASDPAVLEEDCRRPRRGERDEHGYEVWLARQSERLDPLMAFLGIVFALVAAFQLADPQVSAGWERALGVATWSIWAIFVVDFVVKVAVAPSPLRFVRRHWLSVLMLLVPTLRLLRFGALLRLGRALPAARVVSTSYRATGVARRLMRSRASFLAAVAAIATLAAAELAWLSERATGTFDGFGDALLWAAACVMALHADPTPETVAGRLSMLLAFGTGLVLVATLAGTVGAYLLEERRERAEREGAPPL